MKSTVLVTLALFSLAACSHGKSNAEKQAQFQIPTAQKLNVPAQCPSFAPGAFALDSDPTRVVTWIEMKPSENAASVQTASGGGFPDRTADGSDTMDSDYGHHVAYCANGRIYFEDNGPLGHQRGVITPDSTGYSYFTTDANVGGRANTIHFTKL